MASIFTKILRGELPSYKVYEDEHCFAFLTIDPIQPGHTLVVPKTEIDHFADVNDAEYQAVFRAAKPLSRAIKTASGCKRVGMAVVGLEVPHFHLHLIPLFGAEDLDFKKAHRLPEAEMKDMQAKILAKLKS
ncbi:MAG: HIT family protein [Bdellovibrionota bacterium]